MAASDSILSSNLRFAAMYLLWALIVFNESSGGLLVLFFNVFLHQLFILARWHGIENKENFSNDPTCRLINPSKSEIGKVSKQIYIYIYIYISSISLRY